MYTSARSRASSLSEASRIIICYFTIGRYPIFATDSLSLFWISQIFSIYVILKIIAYRIVGKVYERGDAPVLGVSLYWVVHTVLVLITWGILVLLTCLDALPIR